MKDQSKPSISRRQVLKLLGAGSAGLALAACRVSTEEPLNSSQEDNEEVTTVPAISYDKQPKPTYAVDNKPCQVLELSSSKLNFVLKAEDQRLSLDQYGANGISWLHANSASGLFAVYVNDQRFTALDLTFEGCCEDHPISGMNKITPLFKGPGFAVEQHFVVYEDTALVELWLVVRNLAEPPCRVERVDSFSLDIPEADYRLHYYSGDWGAEFKPEQADLSQRTELGSWSGRSSKGQHPWFALEKDGRQVLSGSVMWSGNWTFRFEPLSEGHRISGGLNNWSFAKMLSQGETLESPHVVLVLGDSLNSVSQQYARVGRKHWYPRNALSGRLPVEWNHWWPYEDADINEQVFTQNIEKAAELGVEVCTLDAGWYGPSSAGTHWKEYRGDWDMVNDKRFPGGIRLLSDRTHARNMQFGLWCEIEALGINAQLAKDHPEFMAMRDGASLGYVCFGNPDVQEWAFQTLSRLITEYNCDWIKLDFNLDPGAGCARANHGHQMNDGLYAHYRGYYSTLERVRQAFPEVVLENCSSGGLRIDLGILRQTHMTFLSDPDWPVHDLQIFWGASTMLATDVLLHWGFCEWRGKHPQQTFNPRDPKLTQKQLDYYTRISMLGLFGFSQKLPELPQWVFDRFKTHTRLYKDVVRRFVKEADFYRLTDQPRRSGEGERWCAFQYSLPDRSEHLLFVFRLPGAPPERSIRLLDLQPDRLYTLEGLEGEHRQQMLGQELMENRLSFTTLEEEDSALLRIS